MTDQERERLVKKLHAEHGERVVVAICAACGLKYIWIPDVEGRSLCCNAAYVTIACTKEAK